MAAEINYWLGFLAAMSGLLALLLTHRLQRLEAAPRPTLRDYFAAKAMQGILAAPHQFEVLEELTGKKPGSVGEVRPLIAAASYCMADAMLAQRERGNG